MGKMVVHVIDYRDGDDDCNASSRARGEVNGNAKGRGGCGS